MVVLSSILSNDPGCSNPLLGYSNEPVNIVGLNDRLPMVFFLALSMVQMATILRIKFICLGDLLHVYFRPAQSLR